MNDFHHYTKSSLFVTKRSTCKQPRLSARNHQHVDPYCARKRRTKGTFYDIYSLIKDRLVFMFTEVESNMASLPLHDALLEQEDPKKDIIMYINSPGGHVTAGLGDLRHYAICETGCFYRCNGMAASMGAVLLCGGAKENALHCQMLK
jgi:ATP-dependent Clp endopeptidase proteolytic subunit ClpP